ncbi:MAG: extracellular solute-binding protein [Clostridiales bacterium]|nr:extracellular solute-binding protein [Clostridiales bacterium]
MLKKNKLIALLLSSVMAAGAVTACSPATPSETAVSSETTETSQTEPEVTETTAVPDDLEGYKELDVADVSDKDDGKIVIYSYNSEFVGLAEKYAGITGDDYSFVQVQDSDDYQEKLDEVLSSGEDAPDIFVCDASYAKKYLDSGYVLAINELGIDYSECTDMFDYTLRFASDSDSVIRGLSWKACPCGVFYERSVAEKYLGTSDPEELAASFDSWDSIMESAKKVNTGSDGSVKLISGYTELYNAFLASRSSAWTVNGKLNIDPGVEKLFDYAKKLYDEELTFNDERWTGAWWDRMSDRSVVSFWGSLQFARYQMDLNPGEGTTVNPTSGDWGLTSAPVSYYNGGCWVMVSKYCTRKAAAADIIRAVCLNEDNLRDMVNRGEFVNSISLMTEASQDDKFCLEWLGGQNPYAILLESALNADASTAMAGEGSFEVAFNAVIGAYCEGAFDSVKEAEDAFKEQLTEDGLI